MEELKIKIAHIRELGIINATVYETLKQKYAIYNDERTQMAYGVSMGWEKFVQEFKNKYAGSILEDDYLKCSTYELSSILNISAHKINKAIKELSEMGLIDVLKAGLPNTRYIKIWGE